MNHWRHFIAFYRIRTLFVMVNIASTSIFDVSYNFSGVCVMNGCTASASVECEMNNQYAVRNSIAFYISNWTHFRRLERKESRSKMFPMILERICWWFRLVRFSKIVSILQLTSLVHLILRLFYEHVINDFSPGQLPNDSKLIRSLGWHHWNIFAIQPIIFEDSLLHHLHSGQLW